MNLQELIDQRTHCPICETALITQFISSRKQKIKIENDRIVAIFVMKGMRVNQPDYEVGYSFNPKDNTFFIEFYSEWDHHGQVPMHMIEKFREFHKNLGACKFYRRCTFCNRYSKCSTPFTLDFKTRAIDTGMFDGLQIAYESFGLTLPAENGYKIMFLSNFHSPIEQSEIMWYRSEKEDDARLDYMLPSKHSKVTVSLVPFVSREDTTRRINNLLTFA